MFLFFFQLDSGRKGPLNRSNAAVQCFSSVRATSALISLLSQARRPREGRQQLSAFLLLRFSNQDGVAALLRRAARTKHCCSTG